jgi:hypothetical protein
VVQILAERYEVRELLGRGGMGNVYDGWDRRLARAVAIKLLRTELAAQPDILQRFEAEARAAATLTHPNVVSVFDSGEEDGVPFIVMERLPGGTLADELTAGPVEPGRVRGILADVLRALGAAHAAGLIHRDIKPSNVLFTEDGATKVADFGIAKSAQTNLTQTGQLLGTLAYLSPEQLDGSPATVRSDLYSVGVVGYEALTGERPFQAETPLGLVKAIAQGPSRSIRNEHPDLEPDLAAVIDKAMEPEPELRFGSADEMLAALEAGPPGGMTLGAVPGPAGDSESSKTRVMAGAVPGAAHTAPQTMTLPRESLVEGTGPASGLRERRWAPYAAIGALLILALLVLVKGGGKDRPAGPSPGASASTPAASSSAPATAGGPGATREVGGFNSILFKGPGRLIIDQSGSESLRIEAEPAVLPLLSSEVTGGRLVLGPQPGSSFNTQQPIVYHLTVKSLSDLEVMGSAEVQANKVSTDRLKLEGIGSFDAALQGRADIQDISVSGSGSFNLENLAGKKATVDVSGSGGAIVHVTDRLEAKVSGSGSVEYIGDPAVTKDVSGSGEIRKH